ncbi:unnamed protein product [Ceutorhynchus assimilis]|uniref:SCP domain-containing protein n=1 Tax=Ceutorhynchus assimilis TaxID=467358 RepID=A0A9N9MME2_9CUCU|nr:unnamed protein product [Ceutorhynchus assimilis]
MLRSLLFILICSKVNSFQNLYCQLPCDNFVENVPHTVCDRSDVKCGPDLSCGPDFMVIDLTDDDRQYILDIHNYLRNKVATGHEKRGPQPEASNMQTMSYNKELEFIAQCWANACNGNPLKHDRCRKTESHAHVGQNLGYINSTNPKINKIKAIKDLILLWYDEVALFDRFWLNDTQNRGPKYVVGHYTQLVWAETNEIGCAMSYYAETVQNEIWHQVILVCNYGPGGNYLGQPVYQTGKPASKCSSNLSRNQLYKGLCGQAIPASDVANFTFDVFRPE